MDKIKISKNFSTGKDIKQSKFTPSSKESFHFEKITISKNFTSSKPITRL